VKRTFYGVGLALLLAVPFAAYAQEEPAEPERDRSADARVQNTFYGPAGGIHIVGASSGAPQSVRLQLAADMFGANDFLVKGDANNYFGGTFSLGVTAIEHLELFAALHSHANANSHEEPKLLQVLGDAHLGAKAYGAVLPWLTLGGDLRLIFLNSIGDVGPVFKGTSIGLRGLVSVDFRELDEGPIPLITRFSLDYLFDNSSLLVDSVEDGRYASLGPNRNSRSAEDRHLIRRVERFALGIQRMDMLTVGLGAELPLRVHEAGWFVHPITELSIGIPVNRQGYSCLLTAIDTGVDDTDGCLDVEGFAAMPATWTLGVRAFMPKVPLSLLLGFDIGLSGTSTFVRELAANKPWAFLLGVSYGLDEREQTKEVVKTRDVIVTQAPPELPRIQGVVANSATGAGIEGAVVRYLDHAQLNPQVTSASGDFVSYPFEPGQVRVEASHPDFAPAICAATLPPPGAVEAPRAEPEMTDTGAVIGASGSADSSATVNGEAGASAEGRTQEGPQLNPYLYKKTNGAFEGDAGAQGGPPVPGAMIALRCELTPKPRTGSLRGIVVNADAAGVVGAQLVVTGVATQLLTTDASGSFVIAELPAGSYSVRVEAEGYLLKLVTVEVVADQQASVHIELMEKPKEAQVELTKQEVRIRTQVFFRTNSAEISSEKSAGLMNEIADVLMRNPQVTLVEVQGHTDNQGNPQMNLELSQARAEAVRTWLLAAGIQEARLEAKGYGDTRPLAPNITERAKARNRRVQLVIKQQQ
jgi:outer membrane protein OmpA-like peptidoglycan-associated protein